MKLIIVPTDVSFEWEFFFYSLMTRSNWTQIRKKIPLNFVEFWRDMFVFVYYILFLTIDFFCNFQRFSNLSFHLWRILGISKDFNNIFLWLFRFCCLLSLNFFGFFFCSVPDFVIFAFDPIVIEAHSMLNEHWHTQ